MWTYESQHVDDVKMSLQKARSLLTRSSTSHLARQHNVYYHPCVNKVVLFPLSFPEHGRKWRKTELTSLRGQTQTETHNHPETLLSARLTFQLQSSPKRNTWRHTFQLRRSGSDEYQHTGLNDLQNGPKTRRVWKQNPPSLVWYSRVGCWRSRNFQLEKSPFRRLSEGRRAGGGVKPLPAKLRAFHFKYPPTDGTKRRFTNGASRSLTALGVTFPKP